MADVAGQQVRGSAFDGRQKDRPVFWGRSMGQAGPETEDMTLALLRRELCRTPIFPGSFIDALLRDVPDMDSGVI
jgi:hypothetical protein